MPSLKKIGLSRAGIQISRTYEELMKLLKNHSKRVLKTTRIGAHFVVQDLTVMLN